MRKTALLLIIILLISVVTSCAKQPSGTVEISSRESPSTLPASSAPGPPSSLPASIAPEPTSALSASSVPEQYVPEDIFGDEFNPYCDAEVTNFFNIYAASFDIGDAKLEGKARYVLSMTAEGKADEAVTFLTKLAGLSESDTSRRIQEYSQGGFCEFKGMDGSTFTVRRTDSNDDRYAYVEGCHVDIWFNVNSSDTEKYIKLVSDNYNLNALAFASDYFDVTPNYKVCGIAVNFHKKEVNITTSYAVSDVSAVQQSLTEKVKSDWYDVESGKMGLSYGMMNIGLQFDSKGGSIYVTETTSDWKKALVSYIEPEVSLKKLGFYYAEQNSLCIYEDKQNNLEVALYRPEWGEISGENVWNIEYLDDVDGYFLAIWYYADKNEFGIQIDKNGSSCGYHYYPDTETYDEGYPDPDLVKKMFGTAFSAQGYDVYPLAMKQYEQALQERFGLSWQELYELPIR